MRLVLFFSHSDKERGRNHYRIVTYGDTDFAIKATDAERILLASLAPGIEKMCYKVLGKDFCKLVDKTKHGAYISLQVKTGTATGKNRFNFRSLSGWIELHDFV